MRKFIAYRFYCLGRRLPLLTGLFFLAFDDAFATPTGGLPWDSPIQTFTNDLTGPVATGVSVVAFLAAAAALVFGEAVGGIGLELLKLVGGVYVPRLVASSSALYGGTVNQLKHLLRKMNVGLTWVDPDDPESWKAAVRDNTKIFFGETIGNPGGHVLDIERISSIAHEHGLPLIVDNTFATPYLCRPFEWGADIIVHSLTKFLGGHGNSIGGVLVESGRFDWTAGGKFPTLTEPTPSYHGLRFYETFGSMAFAVAAPPVALRDIGFNPYGNSIIVNGPFLAENPEVVDAFVKTTQQAYATCLEDPKPCNEALAAAEELEAEGIPARVLDAYSIKPIDADVATWCELLKPEVCATGMIGKLNVKPLEKFRFESWVRPKKIGDARETAPRAAPRLPLRCSTMARPVNWKSGTGSAAYSLRACASLPRLTSASPINACARDMPGFICSDLRSGRMDSA